MALISPGVEVDIINESFYGTAGAGTIPLIVFATAANKTAPSGTGIAPFTVPSMANTLFLATSQLELTSNYGTPTFQTYQGTVIQGDETNEWGLHAAYSYLGISNRAYVIRADIDLDQLQPTAISPVGPPNSGQYWFDLSDTVFGVFQANGNSHPGLAWNTKTVTIPTISQIDNNSVPLASFGNVGDICVVPWVTSNIFYQKGTLPTQSSAGWYQIGTTDWASLYPTQILGVANPPTVASGGAILINGVTVTIIASVGSAATLTDVINSINTADVPNITASQANSGLMIVNSGGDDISIADVNSSGICAAMGIVAKTYYGVVVYNTPTSSAQYPDGSVQGSIWVKGNPSRSGAQWIVKYYDGTTGLWVTLSAPFYQFDSTLTDGTPTKDLAASTALGLQTTGSVYVGFDPNTGIQQIRRWNGTYWASLSYVADTVAPFTSPAANTLWYDLSSSFAADIMVGTGNEWRGYRNVYPTTDVNGIQISATAPMTQSLGGPLVANDLWLDSSDQENYPLLNRWDPIALRWRAIDKTDQETPFGVIFADARADSGVTFSGIPNSGAYNFSSTAAQDLVLSDYLDPDAPNPELYPAGMLLFNTRASNNLVKIWRPTYFNPGSSPTNFDPNDDYTVNSYTVGNTAYTFPPLTNPGRWVNAAGNDSTNNNLPFFGRKSQRQMVVLAMRSTVESNQDIRSELIYYNLIACPGYCELIDTMTTLNTDQKDVSFIVGDTPMRLPSDSNSLLNWANNSANVAYTNEAGLAPGSYSGALGDFIGLYYPWGLGTDLSGNEVMIPPSTIALRTIAYSDSVSYPWFAPAGFTRGLVSNASSVGYLTASGAYQPVILNQGQRDTLYGPLPTGCQINPIAYIPGRGLVVYGQKTLSGDGSALDRINVARLVNYLTYEMDILFKPYLFEQNDAITQTAAANTASVFLNGLVGKRAISDYAVKCDSDNNTPDRINANELWIDCAILPIKSVEFIYVPIRILAASTTPITL